MQQGKPRQQAAPATQQAPAASTLPDVASKAAADNVFTSLTFIWTS